MALSTPLGESYKIPKIQPKITFHRKSGFLSGCAAPHIPFDETMSAAVLLPASILSAPSPSAAAGIDEDTEATQRAWGCTVLCEAAVLLKLPQVVSATAQNLLQRFFWRKSLKDGRFDIFLVSMGCLFLATKIEEKPRTLRQVVFVFHHIYSRRRCGRDSRGAPLELGGERYNQWKKKLVEVERHLLKELGFGFYQVTKSNNFTPSQRVPLISSAPVPGL